jgi:hypothetical protein
MWWPFSDTLAEMINNKFDESIQDRRWGLFSLHLSACLHNVLLQKKKSTASGDL